MYRQVFRIEFFCLPEDCKGLLDLAFLTISRTEIHICRYIFRVYRNDFLKFLYGIINSARPINEMPCFSRLSASIDPCARTGTGAVSGRNTKIVLAPKKATLTLFIIFIYPSTGSLLN